MMTQQRKQLQLEKGSDNKDGRCRKTKLRRQQQYKTVSDADTKLQSSGKERSQHGGPSSARSPASPLSESSSDSDFDDTAPSMVVSSVQRRRTRVGLRVRTKHRFAVLKREQAEDRLEEGTDFVLYYEWPSDDVVCHSALRLMIAYRTSFNENRFYRVESFNPKNNHYYHVISAEEKITVSPSFSSIKALVEHHETFGYVWRHPTTGKGLVDVFPWWTDKGHSKAEVATELRRALRRQKRRSNCPMHSQRIAKPQR